MGLPARLLRELLTVLRTDANRHRASDKRVAPRVGMRVPIEIAPCGGVRWGRPGVWVRNLSASGIGLVAGEKLEEGVEFVVPFRREEAGPLRILYRVTHVACVADGLYAVGGRMICVISDWKGAGEAGGRAKGRLAS